MVAELRDLGIELMVSIWPTVDVNSENYDEMADRGLLASTDRGSGTQMEFMGNEAFFDATNPEARAYVWSKAKQHYFDKGIKIFWLDEADPLPRRARAQGRQPVPGGLRPGLLRGPAGRGPDRYLQPDPLLLGGQPEVRHPAVVGGRALDLRIVPDAVRGRAERRAVRHPVVDHRHRRLHRGPGRRSEVP
jgi:alpha-glucosidase (family GH31 glycosyl hydrolase)